MLLRSLLSVEHQSRPITGITFGTPFKYNSQYPVKYIGGDTWYNTWADDDASYTMVCDTCGWNAALVSGTGSNMAVGKLSGFSDALTGSSVNVMPAFGTISQVGSDGAAWKSTGLVSVNGALYCFVSRQTYGTAGSGYVQTALGAQIIKSTDHGATWTPQPPSTANAYASPMFPGSRFGAPSFITYGKDYQNNTRHNANLYVYAVSPDGVWNNGNSLVLGRCLIANMSNLSTSDWTFFQGGNGLRDSAWGALGTAALIVNNANKTGMTAVQYLPYCRRYLMFEWYYKAANLAANNYTDSYWDMYESPAPWGPWTLVQSIEWTPKGFYNPTIIQKSISTDGGRNVRLATTGNFKSQDAATGDYTLTLVSATINN